MKNFLKTWRKPKIKVQKPQKKVENRLFFCTPTQKPPNCLRLSKCSENVLPSEKPDQEETDQGRDDQYDVKSPRHCRKWDFYVHPEETGNQGRNHQDNRDNG